MYKTPKIRLLFLPILAFLLLFQCSKVEENLVTNDFETSQLQSVQDVFIGFLNQGGSRLTGRVSEDNQEFVSVNLNDISLEPLTNSNAMLTVVPAILSATPSTFTRAIALDYGGKTHTAILSLIPNNSNHSNGFSGYSITYKLSGEIINAYRIEADTIVAKLQTSNISITDSPISDTSGLRIVDGCDCDTSPLPDCCFEEQLLDEVVIIANTGGIPAEHLFEPSEHEGIDLDAQEPVSLLVGGGGSLWLDCDPDYERDNQGNCVTPEEDNIVNDLTNPCAKELFTELLSRIDTDVLMEAGDFADEVLRLFDESQNTDLTIRNGSLVGVNASTVQTTITMNDSFLQNATTLAIVGTMIHEMTHAYLNAYFYGYPDFQDRPLRDKLHRYASENGYTDLNRFHHEFMGQYVSAIAFSLRHWDLNHGTRMDLGLNYYTSMAFGGLYYKDLNGNLVETDSFIELIPSQSDRDEIKDRLIKEQNGETDSKGKRCD